MWSDARAVLDAWQAPDAAQEALRREYLHFLAAHADAMWRSCTVGHLTASALVVNESRRHVLLTLHPKVGRWLQLGGHCEPADLGLRAAAHREVREESGIDLVRLSAEPMRLDRHPVPCGGRQSEHLDVQYLAVVPDGSAITISAESDDLRWFDIDALPNGLDGSVRALVDAASSHRAVH